MSPPLHRVEHFDGGRGFGLAQPPGRAESRIRVDQRGAPELAPGFAFGIAFFSPLWPM